MQKCADQTVPGTITERPKAQKGTVTSTPSQHQGHKDTAPRQDKKAKAPRHTLRHDQRRQKIKALSLAHSKKKKKKKQQQQRRQQRQHARAELWPGSGSKQGQSLQATYQRSCPNTPVRFL